MIIFDKCYYLPMSDCKAEIGAEQKYQAIKPKNKKENRLFQWLRLYATRPQQHVRKHVYDFITKVQGLPRLPWNMNCTGMHIRRGGIGSFLNVLCHTAFVFDLLF